ncbi:MAG TPA: hypothetical protein VH143_29895 [Kofleriaceae bacterium]|jgi:hypothetical protein|nr:hypothetical protein [Kofleriaceae bacterium]
MDDPVPARVREYADQAVAYVKRTLGVTLEYDSNTLPLLDHYLRSAADAEGHAFKLVIATAGAYFGEVVRRSLGGRWELPPAAEGSPSRPDTIDADWRVVLPTGLNFSPVGFAASAIAQADVEDFDCELDAPARMRPYVQQTLSRMGEVSVEDYYSLCGRLDTLEHVHEVLVAVAAQMMGDAADPDPDAPEAAPDPVADDPSGAVN